MKKTIFQLACFSVVTLFLQANSLQAQWSYTLHNALDSVMYNTFSPEPCCFLSGYALQNYFTTELQDESTSYTVFVPNDAAVEAIQGLMNLNQWDLLTFSDLPAALSYHIVPGTFLAEDLATTSSLATLEGQSLSISSTGDAVLVDGAQVIESNILADNGVIHVIDQCLAPAGYPEATVVSAISESEVHQLFEQGIYNAYLADYLSENALEAPDDNNGDPTPGPFTVFAPTDEALTAFATANGFGDVQGFLTSQYIEDFVERHIVVGYVQSTDLNNGDVLTAMNGSAITIDISLDNSVYASGALVETPDLLAYNGVVHSIGDVLPFEIPAPSGTCGSWTINTYNWNLNEGWGDAKLDIFKDGAFFSATGTNEIAVDLNGDNFPDVQGMSSYSFAVNDGDVVDFIFNRNGSTGMGKAYEILNEQNEIIFSSASDVFVAGEWTSAPASVFGLRPCNEESTCGYAELRLIDESQEGWMGGTVAISSESQPDILIDFSYEYTEHLQSTINSSYTFRAFAPVADGQVDFEIVNAPSQYTELCGYSVLDVNGQVVVDQTGDTQEPQSVDGIEICSDIVETEGCNATFDVVQSTSTDGENLPSFVEIILYDINPNASYSWSFGDGGTSAYPLAFWTYEENGPYEVCLTVTDLSAGCSASFCDSVSVDEFGILVGAGLPLSGFTINVVDGGESNETSGLDDVSIAQSSISIYPNPTNGMTFVDGIAANTSWKGTIFNSNGSVAKTCSGVGSAPLSFEGLRPGLYLFSLDTASGGRHTSRIVVE